MKLTASIVTYMTPHDELGKCLESLRRDGVCRVYVIDNSPDDSLRSYITSHPAGDIVEYIDSHKNPGYGAAHNIALRRAIEENTSYHLVINSDVYFDRGVLPSIVKYMDSHPDIGLLQPRIISPDGSEQFSSRLLPTPLDLIGRRFLPGFLSGPRNRRYLLADRPAGATLNIPYHQGSFMFFRVDVLSKAGLFDERFFMYPEDIDITRRIHALSPTIYWPGVTVTHAHRASSYHSLRMLRIHAVNIIRYFNKWGWFYDRSRRYFNQRLLKEMATMTRQAEQGQQ